MLNNSIKRFKLKTSKRRTRIAALLIDSNSTFNPQKFTEQNTKAMPQTWNLQKKTPNPCPKPEKLKAEEGWALSE